MTWLVLLLVQLQFYYSSCSFVLCVLFVCFVSIQYRIRLGLEDWFVVFECLDLWRIYGCVQHSFRNSLCDTRRTLSKERSG